MIMQKQFILLTIVLLGVLIYFWVAHVQRKKTHIDLQEMVLPLEQTDLNLQVQRARYWYESEIWGNVEGFTKSWQTNSDRTSISIFHYETTIYAAYDYHTYHIDTQLPREVFGSERKDCEFFGGNTCVIACTLPNAGGYCNVRARYGSYVVVFFLGSHLVQKNVLQDLWQDIDEHIVDKLKF